MPVIHLIKIESCWVEIVGHRKLIIVLASEGNVPEASHHPVGGRSGCFLELVGWQKASKHADFIFQTKIKEGTFVGSFCFPLTLILMQTGSFCQDKHDVLALLLSMVLAEGHEVSRVFEGRKVPIMKQLGRS